ncbi:hypothetical protein ACJMK2_024344 [Sinanodonta woodiana]|uniref:Fibrinogen C-terminal domain-containing protein n=1 Tax=Sinanodonta woodiana TaxID=1069815 RepID=A0ABD3T8X9_SINWO
MLCIIALFHLPTIIILTIHFGMPCYCNPVFHDKVQSTYKSGSNPIVDLTKQLLHGQFKQIFENDSRILLDNRDKHMIARLENVSNEHVPRDCMDIQLMGHNKTGIYMIYPTGTMGFSVRCDMDTDGGSWTVLQRRFDGSVNFARGWTEYQVGFGNMEGEFWLGNQQIHMLTSQGWYELRIDMRRTNMHRFYAKYNVFSVASLNDRYRLIVDGFSGTGGDSLYVHSGYSFSTIDSDSDSFSGNCALAYQGGWWYSACHWSNLNGVYGSQQYGTGLNWYTTTGYYESLSFTEMKTRRWVSK